MQHRVAAVAVVVLALALALDAGTFVRDFTQADGPPEGWVITGPTVAVVSGVLNLTVGSAAEIGTVVGVGGQAAWFDRIDRIEAQIAFPGVTTAWPFDHGGVFFCAQAPAGRYATTCYVIDYLTQDSGDPALGRFRLAKFVNGAEQPLTQTAQDITDYEGAWSIELTDTEIVFTIDGVEKIRYANADLRGGYMGFWAYQSPATNHMTVDDLTVTYTPATCPAFLTSKVALTAGLANQLAPIRIPTGANDVDPYVVTVTSADPAVAAPVGHTGGALAYTFAPGTSYSQTVEIAPGAGGETTLGLSVEGTDCSDVSAVVEVLGLVAYEETFTQPDGPPEGWYIASQSALVVNEVLSLKRGTADPFVWYAIEGVPLKVGKMESLRCMIKFARTTNTTIGCHGGMVLAPAVTASRQLGYMIDVIERASDNGYRIYKDNNAAVQLGGIRPPFVWDDQFHEWKITFTPTGFTFSLDGVQLTEVHDLSYRGGYLSFWCYTGADTAPQPQNMFVDDIRIEFGSTACPTASPLAHETLAGLENNFNVLAPFGANADGSYLVTVTSTDPAVAVPAGGTGGELDLSFPAGAGFVQTTFTTQALAPGTVDMVLQSATACLRRAVTLTVLQTNDYANTFTQDDGAPARTTILNGGWTVSDEKLTINAVEGGEVWMYLGDPPLSLAAHKISFTMNLTHPNPADAVGRHAGVMLCAKAPVPRWQTSGYEIDWIDRESDRGYRLSRFDNGVATALAPNTGTAFDLGSAWEIEFVGNKLRLTVDGQVIVEVADEAYRGGYVGFWAYAAGTVVVIDDIKIGDAPPVASIAAAPLGGQAPLEVTFSAAGSSDEDGTITSYAWDFGDGGTSADVDVVHTYADVGTYTATLTVTDDFGNTAAASVTIVADTAPVAAIAADPVAGRAPLEVTFSGAGSTDDGTIESYAWDFGDGETGEGVEIVHAYAAEGEYTATLTVTDNFGNTGTASVAIAVEPAGTRFTRGDTNADGKVDIADAITTLGYLFGAEGDPSKAKVRDCFDAADANDDGKLDIADAIKVLGHLFASEGPLPGPFAECGLDPSDDELTCETFPPCP